MKEITCCFTGHREIPIKDLKRIKSQAKLEIEYLISKGITNFICGGAIGFDMLCGQIVIKLKWRHPKIKLFLALPCRGQDKFWNAEQKEAYKKLLAQADKINFTSENFDISCMYSRNRYMVDNSAYIIAYCTKESGGSYYTLKYAKSKQLIIITV